MSYDAKTDLIVEEDSRQEPIWTNLLKAKILKYMVGIESAVGIMTSSPKITTNF